MLKSASHASAALFRMLKGLRCVALLHCSTASGIRKFRPPRSVLGIYYLVQCVWGGYTGGLNKLPPQRVAEN
jgi:hypothetical protein